ncbi:MAG: LysM peptidoglycan-binding domain-containing protein, partial [Spirochaetes bacterium]|nr:LysM peptidoglycan-binding domain-containing protein [Spirochaetota bacterium]
IKKTEQGYLIAIDSIPFTFVLSESHRAGDEKQFGINPLTNLCIPPFRKMSEKVSLAEGIPFTIQSEPINEGTFLDTYCTELFYSIEGFLDAAESSLARHLLKLLEDLDHERVVKESLCGLKKEIRKIKLDSKSHIILLLNNFSEACLYYLNNKENKAKLKGRLSAFKSRVNKLLGSIDKIAIPLPFTGDCFTGTDSSYILYRPVKSTISREDSLLSEDVRKVVTGKKTGNLVFYSQEEKRLTGLIAKIVSYPAGRPGKGKTPSKEMVIPSKHEEEPHTAVKPSPVRKKRAISPVKIIVPAAVIILLAVIFLLPPFSLLQKSLKRAEEKQKITEEVSTGESIVSEQPEETQAAVKKEELTAGKPTTTEQPEEITADRPTTTEQPEEIIIPEIDREKVESFLSLGYIQITILDVYYLTNKIAAANGYVELDSVEQLGKNPNWIYPGNVFVLPDETQYTVLKGDTIWHIAKRFIQKNLDRDWAAYRLLIEEIDSKNKNEIIAELEDLNKGSYSENFSKEINRTIDVLKQNPDLTD